jgi:hypothetical protein
MFMFPLGVLLLTACWADFPDDLVIPDRAVASDTNGADAATDMPAVDTVADGPATDGPEADGPTADGPAPDLPLVDGSGPDIPPDPDLPPLPDALPTTLKAFGVTCASAGQCYSGYCVDGVCCNGPCVGACMRCDVAGKEGQCYPVPAGQDPDNECAQQNPQTCGLDGFCDGMGGCRKWPGGTVCAQAACGATGSINKVILAKVCDGAGVCVGHGEVDCGTYRCNPATKACYESCTSNTACMPSINCGSGRCGGKKKPNGAACTAAIQCESGYCTDGACCDGACSGTCKTCKLTGLTWSSSPVSIAGKCINIPSGMDPGGECSATAKHSCGTDGTCSGAGSCRLYVKGTICQTRLCDISSDPNVLNPFHRCNGTGLCQPDGAPTSCGAYVCVSWQGCYGRCTSSAQCATGTCNTTTQLCQ